MSKTLQPTKKKLEFLKRYPQSELNDIIEWDDACRAGDSTMASLLNPVIHTYNPTWNNEYHALIAQGYWVRQIGCTATTVQGGQYRLAFCPMFGAFIGDTQAITGPATNVLRIKTLGESDLQHYVNHKYIDPLAPLPRDFSYRAALASWLGAMGVYTWFPWVGSGAGRLYDSRTKNQHTIPHDEDAAMMMLVRLIKDAMRNPARTCSKGIGYHRRLIDFTEQYGYIDCVAGRAIQHIVEWTSY